MTSDTQIWYGSYVARQASGEHQGLLHVVRFQCPFKLGNHSLDAAKAVIDALPEARTTPVITCWLGERAAADARRLFAAHRVPTYETPDDAMTQLRRLLPQMS